LVPDSYRAFPWRHERQVPIQDFSARRLPYFTGPVPSHLPSFFFVSLQGVRSRLPPPYHPFPLHPFSLFFFVFFSGVIGFIRLFVIIFTPCSFFRCGDSWVWSCFRPFGCFFPSSPRSFLPLFGLRSPGRRISLQEQPGTVFFPLLFAFSFSSRDVTCSL